MVMVSHRRDARSPARNTAGAQAHMRLALQLRPLPSLLPFPLAARQRALPGAVPTRGQPLRPAPRRNPAPPARVGFPTPGRAACSSRHRPAPISRPIPGTDNRLAANEVQT